MQSPLAPRIEVSVDHEGRSPLHYAALKNDAREVTRLIAAGNAPDSSDSQGFTPLHFAAQEYALNAAASLLDLGATVDQTNHFGNTPLFVAVFNSRGRPEMINLLRSRGADPLESKRVRADPGGTGKIDR